MFTLRPNQSEISIDILTTASLANTSNIKTSNQLHYHHHHNHQQTNNKTLNQSFIKPVKSLSFKLNKKMKLILNETIPFLIVVSFCLLGVYNLIQSIVSFNANELTSQVLTLHESVRKFPTVSICNSDGTNSWSTYYPKILKCSFDLNDECSNQWDHYFEAYNDTYYGVCYRFNSGKTLASSQAKPIFNTSRWGESNGFLLDIFVPSSVDFGQLKIHIHESSLSPSTIFDKGFHIRSGSFNYFKVNTQVELKLEEPYNKCLKNVDSFQFNKTLIRYMKAKNQSYSFEECVRLCENLKFIETSQCECNLTSLDDLLYKRCSTSEASNQKESLTNCVRNFRQNFNYDSVCRTYCPQECDSLEYKVSHLSEGIPVTGKIVNNLEFTEFETYDEIRRSFFSINVFFQNNKYTLIEQKPKMTWSDLIPRLAVFFSSFVSLSLLVALKTFKTKEIYFM